MQVKRHWSIDRFACDGLMGCRSDDVSPLDRRSPVDLDPQGREIGFAEEGSRTGGAEDSKRVGSDGPLAIDHFN